VGRWGGGGSVMCLVLRIGECVVSGKSWVEVGSGGGGRGISWGGFVTGVVLIFRCRWWCIVRFDTGVVLVLLVVALFDRIGLEFGLGDNLLRHALKTWVDGCCSRLKWGGVVWWIGVV